ncbi:Oligoendopeptidase, pepF/M3 family [Syntrophobacter sp. SbD1]|nr:Oligoendopeptidase, pepF/M3 family [Syntrophobacter sp. SbD1]
MKKTAENVKWDLDDLYSGTTDTQIESDSKWLREQAANFSSYRGGVADLGPEGLLDAIVKLEQINERAQKLLAYAYLNFSTQTADPAASAFFQSRKELYSEIRRDTLFFELEWTKLEDSLAAILASDPVLSKYSHYLVSLRRYKPHLLSEPEERILAEKEPAGASAWGVLFEKMLSQLRFGERKRTESEVLSELYSADREVRKHAAHELTHGLQSIGLPLTHIFNTILLDKSIDDRLRRYPNWLSARNLGNEADDAMVGALVNAVSSRYDLVQRYYRLKRKLLGYEELFDYDRYAPVKVLSEGETSWDEAKEIVLASYGEFSADMAKIANRFFDEDWIHASVLPGKRSGAFAHPVVPSLHPYIFLNFTGRRRDIMTLAHELGHGIHQYLARDQGLFNSDTPLTTAESASVFGEMLVFRSVLKRTVSPAERLGLLCSKIEDTFATVFRQVAMNRFEDAVHNARRTRGELNPDFISSAWMNTQAAMFGESVRLLDHYKIWWSYIPHFIHSPGYVYAYAFGELLVMALYKQYLDEGPDFVPKYLEFLGSGAKAEPGVLLRPFGVDLADPRFWDRGVKIIEELVAEAEKEASR